MQRWLHRAGHTEHPHLQCHWARQVEPKRRSDLEKACTSWSTPHTFPKVEWQTADGSRQTSRAHRRPRRHVHICIYTNIYIHILCTPKQTMIYTELYCLTQKTPRRCYIPPAGLSWRTLAFTASWTVHLHLSARATHQTFAAEIRFAWKRPPNQTVQAPRIWF